MSSESRHRVLLQHLLLLQMRLLLALLSFWSWQLRLLLTMLSLCSGPHLSLDLLQRMNAFVKVGTEVQIGGPVPGARVSGIDGWELGCLGREVVVGSIRAIAARKNGERRLVGPDCVQLRRMGCIEKIRIGRATWLDGPYRVRCATKFGASARLARHVVGSESTFRTLVGQCRQNRSPCLLMQRRDMNRRLCDTRTHLCPP